MAPDPSIRQGKVKTQIFREDQSSPECRPTFHRVTFAIHNLHNTGSRGNTRPFKEVFERDRRRFENALGDFLARSWHEYDPSKVFAMRNKAHPQDVHEVLVRTIQGLLESRILCHVGGICADPSPDWKLSVLRRAFPRIFRTPEVKALKAGYAEKMERAMKEKHRRWRELLQTKGKKESQGVRETPRMKRLRRNKARYLQSRDKQE